MNYKNSTVAFVVVLFLFNSGNLFSQGLGGIMRVLDEKTRIAQLQAGLMYGGGDFSRTGLTGPVSSLSMIGGSFGYKNTIVDLNAPSTHYLGINVLLGSTSGSATAGSGTFNEVGFGETTALGATMISLENRQAMGYSLSTDFNLMLSTGGQWTWTSVSPKSYATADTNNWRSVDDFVSGLNFGSTWSPGIELNSGNFGVRVGYNWTQIYPRHMYWYWITSEAIENIAQTGAFYLINAVSKKGETAYPIINFVLTNAVSYLFSELRTDKMNWPWDTVAPMNIKSWNLSVNYAF
jgi:hypothetical protein